VPAEERLRLWGRTISVGEARLAFRRGRVQAETLDL
jgi:hypothetical protein